MQIEELVGGILGTVIACGATYGAVRSKLDTVLGKAKKDDVPLRDTVMEMKGILEQVAMSTSRLEYIQDRLSERTARVELVLGLGPEDDTPPQPHRRKLPSSH